jgi:transcriptional regulator with XRE-family HTH domain
MKETFGMYVRKHRNSKAMTLTQLAAKLSMDSANLSKVENGIRGFDEKRIPALASVLGLCEEEIQNEFLSDIVAKKLYKCDDYNSILTLAEDKIKYLKQSK